MTAPSPEGPRLERTLGLFATTLMGVGVILGAGIYALVGKAAGLAGNAVWASFLAAALFSALTGLGYAELSSFIPRAGGQYAFVRRAFGEGPAFVVAWLLLGGMAVLVAAVAIGFASYFRALVDLPAPLLAAGLIALTTAVLVHGIRESAWFAGACTVVEALGLLVVIAVGAPHLGEVDLLEAPLGLDGLLAGAALIFFAYIGFEEIVQLAEETRDPTRTVPRALLLSLAITTVLYVLVALAAVSVVGWERLSGSEAPLAEVVGERLGAGTSTAIVLIALFSTANTVLMLLLSASRLTFGMAGDGALPEALARVHPRRRTPWVSTLVVALVAAGFVLGLRRIEVVASVGNFAILAAFVCVNAAVVALRFREPDTPRPFRVPGSIARVPVVPVLAILGAAVLMARTGALAALLGAALILSGLLVRRFVRRRPAAPERPGSR